MTSRHDLKTIHRVNISLELLDCLTDEEKALFALINHAVSEINVLGRLAYYSTNDIDLSPTLKAAVTHQSLTIIRCLSAKLFEFSETMKKQAAKSNEDKTDEISQFASFEFALRGLEENYNIIRNIRDFTTNHYSIDRVKQNLPHLTDQMHLDLYLAEPEANSFSMIGDEMSFQGRINRMFASVSLEEGKSGFDVWWKWNLTAWKWTRDVGTKTNKVLLLDNFPNLSIDVIELDLPDKFVGDRDTVIPVFTAETNLR